MINIKGSGVNYTGCELEMRTFAKNISEKPFLNLNSHITDKVD